MNEILYIGEKSGKTFWFLFYCRDKALKALGGKVLFRLIFLGHSSPLKEVKIENWKQKSWGMLLTGSLIGSSYYI